MTKVVNIYPKTPIITVNPPIRATVNKVTKTTSDIYKCIIARAIVEEVLSDGSTVRLTFMNYDKDNEPKEIEDKAEEKQEVPIVDETTIVDTEVETSQEETTVTEGTPVVNDSVRESHEEENTYVSKFGKNNRRNKNKRQQPRIIGGVTGESTITDTEVVNFDELNIETIDAESI